MTTHVVRPEEWATALKGTELEAAVAVLPANAQVFIVCDNDGATIGAWSLIPYLHVEGLWVHPDHRRRGRVLARLLAAMRTLARAVFRAEVVLTAATTPEVRALILKYGGVPIPVEHFAMPVERRV